MIWTQLGSVVGALLKGLAKFAGLFTAFKWGQSRERQKSAEKVAKVKDDQLEIASQPNKSRKELLDDMSKRKRKKK